MTTQNQPQKQLVNVKTGEPYQPVRIYYQIFKNKKKTVLSALQKLKCIEYEPERDRWNWLYEAEAKKLRFTRSYGALTAADKPLILGYFTFRGEEQMLLDLRSFERATHAIDFFDKRINRYAATPTHMRIVNRLFSLEDMPNREIHPSLDPFFDRENVPCLAHQMEQQFEQIEADYADDPEGKEKALQAYLDQHMNQPHPEIEELIIHPDKIDRLGLPMALQMRQVEAFEHWRGNFTFRATDVIQQWVEAMADEFDDEFDDEVVEEITEAEAEATQKEASQSDRSDS
ncbi:MAG: hypothetical protein EDM05_57690 [Leptolyngbya sp. IPPAS B-1204]|uniref:Uncharacterized protein n=1 Tax=Leptolyngbya sp. NK1-12 TaxID=2547451 RepID=A0AA96WIF7_9CYAN|nr:hypothetical protein [Leptolyngbya sp. NK1-12]MBF2047843.1 hypothetical protein [Elainella sp. C42_A2020_010]RNJ65448.1 MAG: hypothetical protein EDM05_31190 [Leptolyngbya sp. IPPAS B-1204]WNZ26138.1 hypothetical protein HJG54_27130 [Leptolyngbya sp. NK1-12]